MKFPFTSRRLPAAVRAALPVEPGERVLVHAPIADGGYAVATDRALLLPDGTRLPWHRIDRCQWEETQGSPGAGGLEVVTTEGVRHRVALPEPGRLPEAARERVIASIVVSRHVRLTEQGGVRLVARRSPGAERPVWELIYDEGLDPSDPGLRAAADQALAGVRRSLGV
jgi:hypothetical protein